MSTLIIPNGFATGGGASLIGGGTSGGSVSSLPINLAVLPANQTESAGIYTNLTGLTFPMVAGRRYYYEIVCIYTASATTCGIRIDPGTIAGFTVSGIRGWINSNVVQPFNVGSSTNASTVGISTGVGNAAAPGGLYTARGACSVSPDVSFQLQFSRETAATGASVTVYKGSYIMWKEVVL